MMSMVIIMMSYYFCLVRECNSFSGKCDGLSLCRVDSKLQVTKVNLKFIQVVLDVLSNIFMAKDEAKIAVSFAYIAVCMFFDFGMSLIYMIKKRRATSMKPCGTPASTLLTVNNILLSIYGYDLWLESFILGMFIWCSLVSKALYQTESNTFSISSRTSWVNLLLLLYCVISRYICYYYVIIMLYFHYVFCNSLQLLGARVVSSKTKLLWDYNISVLYMCEQMEMYDPFKNFLLDYSADLAYNL